MSDSTQSSSTYKPFFTGLIDKTPCFCFTFPQTKSLAQDIVNSRGCIIMDSLRRNQISSRDSLQKLLSEQLLAKDTMISTQKQIIDNREAVIFVNNVEIVRQDEEILKKDEKIKILKIERIAYPILSAIVITVLFLSAK